MSKVIRFASKVKGAHANQEAAQNARLTGGLCRFANEQVDSDKAFLNVNGYVMSVRLPY